MKLFIQEDYNKFVRNLKEPFDSISFNPLMLAFAMTQEFDDEDARVFAAAVVAWFVFYYQNVLPTGSDANRKTRWVAHDVANYTSLGQRMMQDMNTADY